MALLSVNPVMTYLVPHSGKVWQGESLANWLFLSIWRKKVWRINRSANRLSIVSTKLDGFSLANHRQFAKFTKLSPCQTFPLYGIMQLSNTHTHGDHVSSTHGGKTWFTSWYKPMLYYQKYLYKSQWPVQNGHHLQSSFLSNTSEKESKAKKFSSCINQYWVHSFIGRKTS